MMPQPRPTRTGGIFVVIWRAFHIATKVNAATSTLNGRASPIAAKTRVKRMLSA
jgi:hypothetical protein